MDISNLWAFLLGSTAGVFTGIIPGLGPAHLLAILYYWITGWNPVNLVIFYIAYITVSNFVDAIPSLYFGVPGEISSVPASRESKNLGQQGLIQQTIRLCSVGRVLGGMFALIISSVVVGWILEWPEIFSSIVQMCLYCFTLVVIMFAGNNAWWRNLLFMTAGCLVSAVGYNYYTQQTYGTFGWLDLYNGIPVLPVLIGIYVLPMLWSHVTVPKIISVPIKEQQTQDNYLPSMLRGTAIGYVLGLVPGMSYILSSTAAYNFEKWWIKKTNNPINISVASVVASETASNTGSASLLIPMLLFGIPIIASEVIIFDLLVDAGAVFTQGNFLKSNYVLFTGWFVASCVLGFLFSWPLSKPFKNLFGHVATKKFMSVLTVLIVVSIMLDAIQSQKIILYLAVLLISFAAGWQLRKYDVMPFVFVFVLGASLQSVAFNLLQLYF
jgi:putative tricarboxylic transport membrane protein